MGSVRKVFKKATKVIRKPISKITKGIARGIAKVGKSVMRGVAKIQKKLGPIGMIAMSIAMPYALSGLSNIVGQGAVGALGPQIPSGMMGSQNLFIRSIGNLGNAVRTGYNAATGFIKTGAKSITKGITESFSKLSGGKGNGLWSKISNGAKNLFNSARNTIKKYSPKFRAGTQGSVQVDGMGYGFGETTTMTSEQALKAINSGQINASQISKQVLGSPEGYFTKAGSFEADKLITETLNSNFDRTIGNSLSDNALTHMKNLGSASEGTFANKYDIFDSLSKNKGFSTSGGTADGMIYDFDFAKSGDYTLGTARDRITPGGTYNFNGNSTFNNNVIKQSGNKNALVDKVTKTSKKYITKKGTDYLKNLLSPSDMPQETASALMTPGAEFASTQGGALTSDTNLTGAMGTKYFSGVFGNEAWNKLKNYHRHMNYNADNNYGVSI